MEHASLGLPAVGALLHNQYQYRHDGELIVLIAIPPSRRGDGLLSFRCLCSDGRLIGLGENRYERQGWEVLK
jgi:hypothetical protein